MGVIKEAVVTVRLGRADVDKLDALASGALNRSQIVRFLVEDFLCRPKAEQRSFLQGRVFADEG